MSPAVSLLNFLRKILQNRFMLRNLVARDIRARYTGSFLGLFWAFIHPLTQLAIYLFVFSIVLRVKLGPEYGGINFAIWLMSGMLPWLFFAEVVGRSPGAVIEQASLIKKTVFPSEILLVAHVAAALVNHFIMLGILLAVLAATGLWFGWAILWLPLYLACVIFLALGLAWIVSSVNVFLRDAGQVLAVVLSIWFFLTPIIYPMELVPAGFKPLLAANPLLYPVQGYRMALLGREPFDPIGLALIAGLGLGVLALGGLVFKKLKPAFADVL